MTMTEIRPETAMHLHPLSQILSQRSLDTHFQPIVSVKRKALVGVEALARANDPCTGKPVPPPQLFDWARAQGRLLELDRACQACALDRFAALPVRDPELLMFMNVEASLLDEHPDLSLLHLAQEAGVRPSNMVIEVNETAVLDQKLLEAFVQRHREQGFLIAMDDLGAGHSSLQRWPLLRPDIIKLDRALVDGIAGSFHAQQLVRTLIALSRQTGAMVLAEGVETESDVSTCLDLGVDLFQGYYFARPSGQPYQNLDSALDKTLAFASERAGLEKDRLARRRTQVEAHRDLARNLSDVLSQVEAFEFGRVLRNLPWDPSIESVVLLTEEGLQCSPAVFVGPSPQRERPSLFRAPKPGSDHGDRDYYYGLMESGLGQDCYLSETHLSFASGSPCRTLSYLFQHPDGERYIACLEIGAA